MYAMYLKRLLRMYHGKTWNKMGFAYNLKKGIKKGS